MPQPRPAATGKVVEKARPLPPQKLKGKIAFTQGNGIWVIDPNTRRKHLLFMDKNLVHTSITYSPDLSRIAFVSHVSAPGQDSPGSDIFVMRWDSTQRRRVTHNSPDRVESLRWSPDGRRIAYVLGTHYIMGGPPKYSQEIRVVDMDGSQDHKVVGTVDPNGPAAFNPFWSRDSKRVLFTFYPGALDYEDLGTTKREMRVIGIDGSDHQPFDGDWGKYDAPFVSHDGKWMVEFDLSGGSTGQLDLYKLPEKTRYRTLWHGGVGNLTLYTPIFGPNAEQMVSMGRRSGLIIDAQGYTRIDQAREQRFDMWLLNKDGNRPLRLLVENARLLDWL